MVATADITSFPTARNDATEDKWTKYAQGLIINGVLAGVANDMQVFADSTGMLIKVKTGRCFIDGVAGDLTSQQSLDIAAADPTNPRIDLVVARLTTTSPATVSVRVITGVAASSPAAPAPLDDATHTDVPLAAVRVEALAGTIAAGKVTDARVYLEANTYAIHAIGPSSAFGAGAFGGSGNCVVIGDVGAPSSVYVQAYGSTTDIDMVIDAKGGGSIILENNSGNHAARLDANGTWVVGAVAPAASAAAISVPHGDIGMDDGTLRFAAAAVVSSSASAGGTTPPGQVAGYISVKIDGGIKKIPYYNS